MQIVHHQHVKNRRPWISLHVVSGPWTSIVAALDKGRSIIAVCRRYTVEFGKVDQEDPKRFESFHKAVTPAASPLPPQPEPVFFKTFMEPMNRFHVEDSASLFNVAGWYNNPIPTRLDS